jgi:23S rRNA pseudouridine1911/1915/1917 synthase
MEAIGLPLLGDMFYGPRRVHNVSPRVALHAHRLAFTHPITGQPIDVRTDWPGDLRRTLRSVGLHRPGHGPAPAASESTAEVEE